LDYEFGIFQKHSTKYLSKNKKSKFFRNIGLDRQRFNHSQSSIRINILPNYLHMKKITLLLVFLLAIHFTKGQTGTKYALCIFVSQYDKNTGQSNTNAVNDATIIVPTLSTCGFGDQNIRVLVDSEANKETILKELKALSDKVGESDIVFFHFSGNGQQLSDDNGDEIDGYDESIVPCNAPIDEVHWAADVLRKPGVKYAGQRHIRDDELEKYFTEIKNKIGSTGQLIVMFDCSNSGTASRGEMLTRSSGKFSNDGTPNKSAKTDYGWGLNIVKTRGNIGGKMIVFSAARSDYYGFETKLPSMKSVGCLSRSFSEVFSNLDSAITYRIAFEKMYSVVAQYSSRQTPIAEGDLDVAVFNNKYDIGKPRFEITKIISENTSKNIIEINGGALNNIANRDRIALMPAGTKTAKGKKTITNGTVISYSPTHSHILLDSAIDIKNIKEFSVFVTENKYENLKMGLVISDFSDLKFSTKLMSELKNLKFTYIKDSVIMEPCLTITQDKHTPNKVSILYYRNINDVDSSSSYSFVLNTQADYEKMLEYIKNYAKAHYLRTLKANNYKQRVRLIAKQGYHLGKKWIQLSDSFQNFNPIESRHLLEIGDTLQLTVENFGQQPCYFNIIEITPDNSINVVVPNNKYTPNDLYIREGGKFTFKDIFIVMSAPTGYENLKLISSEKPLDLAAVFKTKGTSRGTGSIFEEFISEAVSGTRDVISLPTNIVTTFDIPIKIVKKGEIILPFIPKD